jgi:hypothetical protein
MVSVGNTGSNSVFATAFKHAGDNTVSVVILNTGSSSSSAALAGSGLPAQFDVYQSTSTQACVKVGTATTSVALPAQSITTLYNGTIPQYPYGNTAVQTPRNESRAGLVAVRAMPQRLVTLHGRAIGAAAARLHSTPGAFVEVRGSRTTVVVR